MVCCVFFLALVFMDSVFGTAGGDVERFIDFVFSRVKVISRLELSAVEKWRQLRLSGPVALK